MQMTNRFISTVTIAALMSIIASCSPYSGPATTGWDSGELQTQIGDKNNNKKKLVMRVWYSYQKRRDGSYDWGIHYSMKAENHNSSGSGWHQVKELYSFTFNAVAEFPAGVTTINESRQLAGLSSDEKLLGLYHTSSLPFFKSKTATGSRSGGPSGISITWP